MYEYKAKILRVVDGDTVDVDIDLGFGVWMHKERVRMMGIDTPESRTRDLVEKQFGLASKEYVKSYLPVGSIQVLKTTIELGQRTPAEGALYIFGSLFIEIYFEFLTKQT